MGLDRLMFGLMYRIGFTPWDGHGLPTRLHDLVEGDAALPKGRALDVGCGTGDMSIFLARQGWDVTAVDFVKRALARARAKSEAAGMKVRFVHADATRLGLYGLGTGFNLVVDGGCLHGLSDADRDAYVRELGTIVSPGGRLVIVAFPENPARRQPPRGINQTEIERRFADGWELVASGPDVGSNQAEAINSYDLRRR